MIESIDLTRPFEIREEVQKSNLRNLDINMIIQISSLSLSTISVILSLLQLKGINESGSEKR